jgi:hypothetical protein
MHDRLMTYVELAEFLGKSEEAARQFAKRRRWRRSISNDDGKARVSVPIEFLEMPRPPVEPRADEEPDAERPDDQAGSAYGEVVTMLRDRIEGLETELGTVRGALELERIRAGQVEVLNALLAIERTRLEEARAREAQRVEDLKSERDRWQAKADEALKALIERTAVVPPTTAPVVPRSSPVLAWWPFRRSA